MPQRTSAALGGLLAAALAAVVAVGVSTPPTARAGPPPRTNTDDADVPAGLTRYESKYYVIYTDLDRDTVRECIVRMNRMAEEYHERTKGFSGAIRTKFPFYLFKTVAEYHAAGGMEGTAGVFMGDGHGGGKLMACAGPKITAYTWHTVQHEGFHQFVAAVIGGGVPPWLNEGLAEYFGESLFTGDGFVTGVVPPARLKRLKGEITNDQLKTLPEMMKVSGSEWNSEMNIQNYDEAWSMVHFLVTADDGKYQGAFSSCIRAVSSGQSFERAWNGTIGSQNGFQERWKEYWSAQPDNPTAALYARARVATFTSFLARATQQKQAFANFAAFKAGAGTAGGLKMNADDWLPPSLLAAALNGVELDDGDKADKRWQLTAGTTKQPPTLAYAATDGIRYVGSYTMKGPHVDQVYVEIDDLAKTVADAESMIVVGKKDQARTLLQNGIKLHPRSAAVPDAKKLLQQCK